ncbi:hypothetical protein N7537_006737 [Penicillium hordei]|uniref:Uncharacterized protein n=1 Tax=Penicillium hordei TaxID=40994 RepID=A0AAD6E8K2_9EURO|nr:uncharacterized protein N7537_006737 [Penicillium hordei]KAJ5603781.1 hypothetical protein N7537_006737 [Penicillium hordei]
MTESKSPVRHGNQVECFLDGLPPSTNRYPYEGKEQFDRILKFEFDRLQRALSCLQSKSIDRNSLELSEYFVIAIGPSSFKQDFLLCETSSGLHLSYHAAQQTLIVRMTTTEHAQVIGALNAEIMAILQRMDLYRAVQIYGNVDVDVSNGNVKRPDWGWGPIRRSGGPKRPGVVVEVGVSETTTKLRNDARMWVDPVKGQVNMAITIKVDRTNPRITLDTYEWDSPTQRPQVTQSCVIEETSTKVTVSQCPITIPFNYMLQRSPEIPKETEIRLEKQNLIDMANLTCTSEMHRFTTKREAC